MRNLACLSETMPSEAPPTEAGLGQPLGPAPLPSSPGTKGTKEYVSGLRREQALTKA